MMCPLIRLLLKSANGFQHMRNHFSFVALQMSEVCLASLQRSLTSAMLLHAGPAGCEAPLALLARFNHDARRFPFHRMRAECREA